MNLAPEALDEELILMLKNGDRNAFTELYTRYKGILILHAYKKLGDFEDAKEIIQEVFSTLWLHHTTLPEVRNCGAYLYTLVRNKVLNFIEHKSVEARYAASFQSFVGEQHYVTDLQLREKEMQAMIDREIDALPTKMREVFLLSRKNHLTHKEIAEKLDISEFTVKNHIKAALKILRGRLGLVVLILTHYL